MTKHKHMNVNLVVDEKMVTRHEYSPAALTLSQAIGIAELEMIREGYDVVHVDDAFQMPPGKYGWRVGMHVKPAGEQDGTDAIVDQINTPASVTDVMSQINDSVIEQSNDLLALVKHMANVLHQHYHTDMAEGWRNCSRALCMEAQKATEKYGEL